MNPAGFRRGFFVLGVYPSGRTGFPFSLWEKVAGEARRMREP